MKYCFNCGKEVSVNSEYCMNCGVALTPAQKEDKGGFIWGLIGFLSPIVGLVIYLMWKDERPKTSKSAGKGALISAIAYAVLLLLYFALFFGLIFVRTGIYR